MSWANVNKLLFGARPIWLVQVIVDGVIYRRTTRSSDYTSENGVPSSAFVGQVTWSAKDSVNIKSIKSSTSLGKNGANISVNRAGEIGQAIIHSSDDADISITIWQGFENDPDNEFITYFDGTVMQFKPTFKNVTCVCNTAEGIFSNKAIAKVVQVSCPYEVFSGGCGIDPTAYEISANVTAREGLTLTVPAAAAYANGYFAGGVVVFSSVYTTIDRHAGNKITLFKHNAALSHALQSAPADITLLPGCKKNIGYCRNVFNNEKNYGGFHHMNTNPYDGGGIL